MLLIQLSIQPNHTKSIQFYVLRNTQPPVVLGIIDWEAALVIAWSPACSATCIPQPVQINSTSIESSCAHILHLHYTPACKHTSSVPGLPFVCWTQSNGGLCGWGPQAGVYWSIYLAYQLVSLWTRRKDYCGLNVVTVKYPHPLPLVPLAIEELCGSS